MSTVAKTQPSYPKKMFYRINEVSHITGLKAYVLRYWETEFPQLRPSKDGNDQRRYKAGDIDLIFEIKHLLYEERFTIAGARKCLQAKSKSRKSSQRKSAPARKPTAALPKRRVERVRKMIGNLRREVHNLRNFI